LGKEILNAFEQTKSKRCFKNMMNRKTKQEEDYCHYSDLPSPMAYVQQVEEKEALTDQEIDRIIEMAWEDRTPFDAIHHQFGLKEADVKKLMKKELKFSSYKLWRERVENCQTKHAKKRVEDISRFKCKLQRTITNNKISKR
jgi:uncharacterized protein (TIGR03643 family)